MPVTATSRLAIITDNVRVLVASTAKFQTLTGTGSAAAAKEFVHLNAVNAETFPYAIVTPGEVSDEDRTLGSATAVHTWTVEFVDEIATANAADDVHDDAYNAFVNDFGDVLDQMQTLGKSGGGYIGPLLSVNPGPIERTKREETASRGELIIWPIELTVRMSHGV